MYILYIYIKGIYYSVANCDEEQFGAACGILAQFTYLCDLSGDCLFPAFSERSIGVKKKVKTLKKVFFCF